MFFFLRAHISLKFQSAASEKSEAITEAADASKSNWRSRRGAVPSGVGGQPGLEGGKLRPRRFKRPATEGRGPAQPSGRSRGVRGRLCESSGTWQRRKGGRSGRQKTPRLVFPKPSSYIANAWSNMGSFIMDQLLAPACKVYHVRCKEVKDWPVFARKVAAMH